MDTSRFRVPGVHHSHFSSYQSGFGSDSPMTGENAMDVRCFHLIVHSETQNPRLWTVPASEHVAGACTPRFFRTSSESNPRSPRANVTMQRGRTTCHAA